MVFGSIFKKFRRNDEVIDLSNLQKKGAANKKNAVSTPQDNPLGFLGSLASSSDGTESGAIETSSGNAAIEITSEGKTRLNGILRDIKAKVDNTYNKIYKISDRLDLLEKKIERLERRAGVEN